MVIHILGVLYIPESPYFLIQENKRVDAEEAMARLRDLSHDCKSELDEIQVRPVIVLQYIYNLSVRVCFTCVYPTVYLNVLNSNERLRPPKLVRFELWLLCITQKFVEEEQKNSYTAREVLEKDVNRRALTIGIGCMFFQQMTGINAIIFYMKHVFEISGSDISPEVCTTIVGTIQVHNIIVSQWPKFPRVR